MNVQETRDELELAEQQLASLRSGKQKPGTYGSPVSDGSSMKVAIDKQLKKIEELKSKLKNLQDTAK